MPTSSPANRTVSNYDIPFAWIQVRQENGGLCEPVRPSTILGTLDLRSQALQLLVPPKKDQLSKGPEYAICRIVDLAAEKAAQAAQATAKAQEAKAAKVVTKEQELNWAIASHDLGVKMTQLKRFLGKGYQVKVTMLNSKKRGKKRAAVDEAKAVLQVVVQTIAEVPGAKETKPREGAVGDTLVLTLHGSSGGAARADASGETGAAETPSTSE